MAEELVKVYIFEDDLSHLYWTEYPISTVGDWKRYSEERSFMIPRAQLDQWKAVQAMVSTVDGEMKALTENG